MFQNRILVLADDLTGALEVGAKLRASRISTFVQTCANVEPSLTEEGVTAVVIDAETRHLDATRAADRILDLARLARDKRFYYIYKKTDSTLRGNIGSELSALAAVFPQSPIVYVPAYPRMGRTTKNGVLYLRGDPVSETAFGKDPLNPVQSSNVLALLAAACPQPVVSGGVETLKKPVGSCIMVCDAETEAEVEALASAFAGGKSFKLAAGPAAFALHLAQCLPLPHVESVVMPAIRSCLIVNGSLHPASLAQMNHAQGMGIRTFAENEVSSYSDWLILKQEECTSNAFADFARRIGVTAANILKRVPFDALIVFGGDTAHAIVEAIGNPLIYPLGEIMEGVPISIIRARDCVASLGCRVRDLAIITKAGGYGPSDLLSSVRKSLSKV